MELAQMLGAVSNTKIKFVTTRDRKSPMPLGRRVVVTGPPELVSLAALGDPRVLQEVVKLLTDPERRWAAEVLLGSLTRSDEDVVDTYAANPEKWNELFGSNAYARWSAWLNENEGKLSWDLNDKSFFVRDR